MSGDNMKIIGITGGAGSGKSEVLKLMKEKFGGFVILTDDVARALTLKGGRSYEKIVEAFGPEILGEDGEIDRPRLAAIVFKDEAALKRLEAMTHQLVKEDVKAQLLQAEKEGYPFAAVESAILLNAGYEDILDEYWGIYTDPAIRRERLRVTRGYSDERIQSVMDSQVSDEELKGRCDRLIINNTTLEDIELQLKHALS